MARHILVVVRHSLEVHLDIQAVAPHSLEEVPHSLEEVLHILVHLDTQEVVLDLQVMEAQKACRFYLLHVRHAGRVDCLL